MSAISLGYAEIDCWSAFYWAIHRLVNVTFYGGGGGKRATLDETLLLCKVNLTYA
jgi:hypothetical protein